MSAPASSVEDWLRSLGLITYTEAFIENGYDELDICKEIGDEDLDAIGVVNSKDRTDILNSVARLKQSGTAVYFVLEGQGNYLPPQVQPRERFDKLKLKMMLHEKLEAQKISLTDSPYTNPDGTQGSLETLAKFLADSLYTFEEDVANALDSLWERQSATARNEDNNTPEPVPPRDKCNIPSKHPSKALRKAPSPPGIAPKRPSSRPPSIPKNAAPLCEQDKMSEGSSPPGSPRADDVRKSIEYLDVENPQKKKKEKRRRPVERNSKLSRSMDSLPTHHVNNTAVKSRERESSSLKSKKEAKEVKSGISFRLFKSKPKKSHGHSPGSDTAPEHAHINTGRRGSADMNASEITMGEEDRMALMICVKQGDLTVEEAVEQLQKYEDERRQRLLEQNKGNDSEDERQASKQKVKRGIFRSTKRKSHSRPNSSDIVACEITMSEENRIQLMKDVRDGKIDVEHAMTRLVSYEEQHGHGYIDRDGKASCYNSKQAKHITRSPKTTLQRTTKGSIKRISGAISAAITTPNPDEPNAIFYTETTESGVAPPQIIPVVASDSSAEPSPKGPHKPHKPPRRKLEASPHHTFHSSSSSLDSTDKIETNPAQREVHTSDHDQVAAKNPHILDEIRELLLQTRKSPEEDTTSETSHVGTKGESSGEVLDTLETVPLCNKHNKTPPPQPNRKGSLPVVEPQRPALEPFGSLPRLPQSQATTNTQRPTIPPRRPERSPPIRPDENPAPQRRAPKIPDRTPSVGEEEQTAGKLQTSSAFPVPPPRVTAKKIVSEGITSADAELQEQQPSTKVFDDRKSSSSQSSKDEEIVTDSDGHEPLVMKKPLPPSSSPETVLTENDIRDPKRSPKQAPIKPKRKPPPLPSRLSQDSMSSVSSQDSVSTTGTDVQTQPQVNETNTSSGRSDSASTFVTERPNSVASAKVKGEVPKRTLPVSVGGDTGTDTCSKPKPARKPVLKPKPKIPAKKPMPAPGLSRIPVRKPGGTNQLNQHHGSSSSVNSNEFIDGQIVSASSSPGGLECSDSVENVTLHTHNNATNHERNTLPSRSKLSIKAPVAPKRPSHSLSDLIERRLRIEHINLAQPPYSDSDGKWHVPSNLVNRYSEELRRSSAEVAGTMDRLRIVKLRNVHRHGEPCDVDNLDLTADELGNLSSVSEWLISLGLPMYIENLREVEYDDMNSMPNMEEKHFNYAGVVDPRHMRRLLTSVALMPKDES